jgi:hypothetical protein
VVPYLKQTLINVDRRGTYDDFWSRDYCDMGPCNCGAIRGRGQTWADDVDFGLAAL